MTKVGTEKGIQQALQMGPDKALVLEDDSLKGASSIMTSNVLSELAKKVDADIIIFGTESTDGYSGVVPQQVSRILSLPCISYVKNIEIDDKVTLTRQTIEGSEKINLPNKCVISVTASGVEPRYPNFKDIMAAKNKPVEIISLNDIQYTAEQNMEFLGIEDVSSTKEGEKIIDEGESHNIIIEKLKEIKAI